MDKIKHLVFGIVATYVAWKVLLNPHIAFGIVLLIGAAKELFWDYGLGKGNPEWLDFIYTAVPASVVYLLILILQK